ncbi:MAG: glycosyltransferase family 39 protein, partial [Patescibacteria group bacterium]
HGDQGVQRDHAGVGGKHAADVAGDPMNDEVTYAFRAIGLVDSFNDPGVQSTPWEWFDPQIPWWAQLSFHDHPPMVFWVQNIFMRLFGESRFAFRLPSAILGIASVALLFLVANRLFSARVGLLSAALLAVTVNHVYVSRVGLQEAYVIFFILLALYLFLKALENEKYFILTGLAVGLGLLAKYTAAVLVPILVTYLVLFRPRALRQKHFWIGVALAVAVASPIAIYNFKLYQATGHLDLQFSYLLGKVPDVWSKTPGKDIGSFADRASIFLPRLLVSQSWLLLALAGSSLATLLLAVLKRGGEALRPYALAIIASAYILAMIMLTGPAIRFLTLLTPFLAIAAALVLNAASLRLPRAVTHLGTLAIALTLAFESFYAINNQLTFYPIGPRPWLSSPLRYENYNWGYNALDDWLNRELEGKIPALTFETKYRFIRDIQNSALEEGRRRGDKPYPALIIFYGNFDLAPELWIFDRRLLYQAWPIMAFKDYLRLAASAGPNALAQAWFAPPEARTTGAADARGILPLTGFERIYLIMQTNIAPA